jgi:hypothetical protein
MNARNRLQMALHGTGVILLGLLAGIPYAMVVTGAMAGEERAWRMAHSEGIQNGMLVLAVAGVAGLLSLDDRKSKLCAWSLIAAAYGNVIASVIGAATGNRGLAPALPMANVVVYVLFIVAVVGVLTGLVLAAIGARNALHSS